MIIPILQLNTISPLCSSLVLFIYYVYCILPLCLGNKMMFAILIWRRSSHFLPNRIKWVQRLPPLGSMIRNMFLRTDYGQFEFHLYLKTILGVVQVSTVTRPVNYLWAESFRQRFACVELYRRLIVRIESARVATFLTDGRVGRIRFISGSWLVKETLSLTYRRHTFRLKLWICQSHGLEGYHGNIQITTGDSGRPIVVPETYLQNFSLYK